MTASNAAPLAPHPASMAAAAPIRIVLERKRDRKAVDRLVESAFGPDRMQKTVYKIRDGVAPVKELSFVVLDEAGVVVGSLRFWPTLIDGRWPAVLLGPLAVEPRTRGLGYGKALMWRAMARCRELGHSRVILVGDPEYYNQFGFRRDLALNLQLPGWVEERRFLALETVAGAYIGVHGMLGQAKPPAPARKKRKKKPRVARPKTAKRRDSARAEARKAAAKRKRERLRRRRRAS